MHFKPQTNMKTSSWKNTLTLPLEILKIYFDISLNIITIKNVKLNYAFEKNFVFVTPHKLKVKWLD